MTSLDDRLTSQELYQVIEILREIDIDPQDLALMIGISGARLRGRPHDQAIRVLVQDLNLGASRIGQGRRAVDALLVFLLARYPSNSALRQLHDAIVNGYPLTGGTTRAPNRHVILFVGAAPDASTSLDLTREVRKIDEALQAVGRRHAFELRQQWDIRAIELEAMLTRHRPAIVHFGGHANEAGELLFRGAQDAVSAVDPIALKGLFAMHTNHVRCVVLNTCFSERLAAQLAGSVEVVAGFEGVLDDNLAGDFATGFYRALAMGSTVSGAISSSLASLRVAGYADVNAVEHGSGDFGFVDP
jgi:hypothetical protein